MTDAAGADANLEELRSVVNAPVVEELEGLKQRILRLEEQLLESNQRADAVGEVLVEAAKRRRLNQPDADSEFSEAIRPEVELAIHASSRADADVMADALYPVLGPAIRKMIASLFTTGGDAKSFTVERVILMHRVTALPIAQYSAPGLSGDDADVISGMLDAIRAFVEDAFEAPESDGLNDLRVGDINVIVETGPLAVLAVVCRGVVPSEFRLEARESLRLIHVTHGERLARFDGDDGPFAFLSEELAELQQSGSQRRAAKGGVSRGALAVGAVLLILVVVIIVLIAR